MAGKSFADYVFAHFFFFSIGIFLLFDDIIVLVQ